MNFFIIGMRVAELRSGTVVKKTFLRLMPANTQQPSTLLPLWYLRFPNFDSSISTIFPELSVTNFWPSSTTDPPKRSPSPDTWPNALPLPGLALASPRTPLAAIQPVSVSVSETYCSAQSPDLFD